MNTSMAFAENNSIQAKFLFRSFWTTAEKERDKILNKKKANYKNVKKGIDNEWVRLQVPYVKNTN